MPQVINTNVASLNTQRNLNTSQSMQSVAIERLSSGLRINSAKDDAAGLAISERFTAQIRGLNQAARNANDGISLAQTAEGSLGAMGTARQRIRELAVQAANGTNSQSDRVSLQREVTQLQSEISRIANTTEFNGQRLLDGSLANTQFQVGANANQTIGFSISSVKANDIGNNFVRSAGTSAQAVTAAAGGSSRVANIVGDSDFTVSGNGTSYTIDVAAGDSAKAIADKVNSTLDSNGRSTGVTAFARTEARLTSIDAGTVTFDLYGSNSTAVSISATVTTSDVSALASAVNAQTANTGISAEIGSSGTLVLKSGDGNDININNYVNSAGGTATLTGYNSFTGAAVGSGVDLTSGAATDSSTVGGMIQFNSNAGFSVSSSATATGLFAAASTAYASSLSAVSSIDITTVNGANDALRTVDAALNTINNTRADLGAVQARFTAVVSSLQTVSENLSASRSRIQDTDFAAETANLTRAQILQQAGVAMLAQANALPQNVLALLRG